MSEPRTSQDIVDQTNALARLVYREMGYQVPTGYRFDQARHPQEKMCWRIACRAQEELCATDPRDALAEIDLGDDC